MQRSAFVLVFVSMFAVAFGGHSIAADENQGHDSKKAKYTYKNPYEFGSDWFSPSIPRWERALAPFAGKPGIHYLEIGVYQGRSFLWVLENIATDPTSRLTGVDIILSYSAENVKLSGETDRIEMIEGMSQSVLATLPPDTFDIIYIDGSHRGDDVLIDAVLAWKLLKVGGVLIFDDYLWHAKPSVLSRLVLPAELRPKEAIDTFVTLFRDQLKIVDRYHQLIVQRQAPGCASKGRRMCSSMGDHVYDWGKRELRIAATGKLVDMTPAELDALEELFRNMPLGEVELQIPANLRHRAPYPTLEKKLGLTTAP